jgi:hypothetical protein
LCLATAPSSFANDRDWKLSTSLNYESGKFGTDTRSDSIYIPFTLKRYLDDWDASLTVPYVSESSNGQVTNVGGRPVRIRGGAGSTVTTTHSGLGDLVARGGYALMKEDPQPFDLYLGAKVKLPTAARSKGLGTGEFDEGLGLEFGKRVIPEWTVLADLYFTFIGDPPGTDLNNQVAADIGFSHPVGKDLTAMVFLEGSNALVSGQPAPLDLRGTLDYKLGEQGSAFVGGLVGLSDGSPDYGLSLGGSFRF